MESGEVLGGCEAAAKLNSRKQWIKTRRNRPCVSILLLLSFFLVIKEFSVVFFKPNLRLQDVFRDKRKLGASVTFSCSCKGYILTLSHNPKETTLPHSEASRVHRTLLSSTCYLAGLHTMNPAALSKQSLARPGDIIPLLWKDKLSLVSDSRHSDPGFLVWC